PTTWHHDRQPRVHVSRHWDRERSALARLRALRDLDLQDLGVDEVIRGHAEAPGGDLADLGAPFGAVARGVLAALAGVRAAPEPVHRDRERLVRLGRQRAERHAGAVEA